MLAFGGPGSRTDIMNRAGEILARLTTTTCEESHVKQSRAHAGTDTSAELLTCTQIPELLVSMLQTSRKPRAITGKAAYPDDSQSCSCGLQPFFVAPARSSSADCTTAICSSVPFLENEAVSVTEQRLPSRGPTTLRGRSNRAAGWFLFSSYRRSGRANSWKVRRG